MSIDPNACVIALPSRMGVFHCCLKPGIAVLPYFLLHHASATSGTMYHTEDCRVHFKTVWLDYYKAADCLHEGHKLTYGGDHVRHVHSPTYGPV